VSNSKISALTSATTPLAGTETLPIVQSSATTKVTVANLTAGRAVATGNLSVTGTIDSTGKLNTATNANTGTIGSFSTTQTGNSTYFLLALQTGNGSAITTNAFTVRADGNVVVTNGLNVTGTIQAAAAATQDAVKLTGRAGGTGTFAVTLTPTTLTASRTLTLPDATTTVVGTDATQTLTNKWVQPRVLASTANSATPTLNTDNYDMMVITGQTVAITSFSTNLTGTPVNGQKLIIAITGTGAIGLTWGASFEASTVALPTTTVTTNRLDVGFIWNVATTKWRCVAVA